MGALALPTAAGLPDHHPTEKANLMVSFSLDVVVALLSNFHVHLGSRIDLSFYLDMKGLELRSCSHPLFVTPPEHLHLRATACHNFSNISPLCSNEPRSSRMVT